MNKGSSMTDLSKQRAAASDTMPGWLRRLLAFVRYHTSESRDVEYRASVRQGSSIAVGLGSAVRYCSDFRPDAHPLAELFALVVMAHSAYLSMLGVSNTP